MISLEFSPNREIKELKFELLNDLILLRINFKNFLKVKDYMIISSENGLFNLF